MLPLILQLLPDIPIVYDDDSYIPGLTDKKTGQSQTADSTPARNDIKWAWLVCCGAFFLVDVAQRHIYASEDIAELIAHFLWTSGRSLAAADTPYGSKVISKGESFAPHAHLQLL